MESVDEVAASRRSDELKKIQWLCKDEGGMVLTLLIEMIELSREVVETICDNANFVDRNNDLQRELENKRLVERLACFNLEVATARKTFLESQVKNSNAKYTEIDEETAQIEENLRLRITSLGSSLKSKRDCIAHWVKDRGKEVAGDKYVLTDRPKAYDAIKCHLKEK